MEFLKNELIKVIIENRDEVSTLFGLTFLQYPESVQKQIVKAVTSHLNELRHNINTTKATNE